MDELQKLALDNFAEVKNKEVPPKDFTNDTVFDQRSFGFIYKIIPHKEVKSLIFRWVLPVEKMFETKKSSRYLTHVFGHEGPNSLLS